MPESKVRKSAAQKKKIKRHHEEVEAREEQAKSVSPASRNWVAPTFVTLGVLGVVWIVVFYIAGRYIPGMSDLGNWNLAIGFGLMIAAFALSTLWK